MNAARVWTETGETWMTSINGTEEEVVSYFLGQWVNIGKPYAPDEDHMVRINAVQWFGRFTI